MKLVFKKSWSKINFKQLGQILAVVVFTLLFVLPLFALAQNQVDSGLRSSGLRSLFGIGGVSGSQSLRDLIVNIIRMLLFFAGMLAVLFVIIGGFQYLTSGGNEEQAEKGKKTLVNAIIGVVLVILSYAIINVVVNTVSTSRGLFG